MNQKIRELAEQAGLAEAADVRGGYIYPAGMEKFAELIIQKCISQIAMIGVSNFENTDISWAVELAISQIRREFDLK